MPKSEARFELEALPTTSGSAFQMKACETEHPLPLARKTKHSEVAQLHPAQGRELVSVLRVLLDHPAQGRELASVIRPSFVNAHTCHN